MKIIKFISITFLALSLTITTKAQIQTNILGCTLGVTSKSTVEQRFKQKGYNLHVSKEKNLMQGATFYDISDGVFFGGILWDDARLRFISGKFASIKFHKYTSEETYNKLLSTLKRKYSRYMKETDYFQDRNTEISVWFFDGELHLSYGNRKLFDYDDGVDDRGADEL
jgi:hypothetical protein